MTKAPRADIRKMTYNQLETYLSQVDEFLNQQDQDLKNKSAALTQNEQAILLKEKQLKENVKAYQNSLRKDAVALSVQVNNRRLFGKSLPRILAEADDIIKYTVR